MSMPDLHQKRIRLLPVYGCFATGFIYTAIGVIALLSFFKLKDGGADEASVLVYLNSFLVGRVFIWIILLGTFSYIAWRIYESITDPYEYGRKPRGLATRAGIVLSILPDGLIAYSAIVVLAGSGSGIPEDGRPVAQRQMADKLLELSLGQVLLTTAGLLILASAIVQLIYGFSQGYRERINLGPFGSTQKKGIHVLARTGYAARAFIIGIIGFFYLRAGWSAETSYIVNTDKAFDFIGDHVGHFFFIVTALGTICYGLFHFLLGMAYDTDINEQ